MSTSHTLIAIGALVLLSTMVMGFNQRAAMSAFDISTSKDNIAMTALGSSYIEYAQGLAYDAYSDTASVSPGNAHLFTSSGSLGPDGVTEDSLTSFNDFDDLHGYVINRAGPDSKMYQTSFTVRYVQPGNVNTYVTSQTYAKRLDMQMWRIHPPYVGGERRDTLKLHYVMGYFLFE